MLPPRLLLVFDSLSNLTSTNSSLNLRSLLNDSGKSVSGLSVRVCVRLSVQCLTIECSVYNVITNPVKFSDLCFSLLFLSFQLSSLQLIS